MNKLLQRLRLSGKALNIFQQLPELHFLAEFTLQFPVSFAQFINFISQTNHSLSIDEATTVRHVVLAVA